MVARRHAHARRQRAAAGDVATVASVGAMASEGSAVGRQRMPRSARREEWSAQRACGRGHARGRGGAAGAGRRGRRAPAYARSQAVVSAGRVRPSRGPLASSSSPAGSSTGAVPVFATTTTSPLRSATASTGEPGQPLERSGAEGVLAPQAQGVAVEREGRAGRRRAGGRGRAPPTARAAGATGRRRDRSRSSARRPPTGSARGIRRGRSARRRCGTTWGPGGRRRAGR